MMKQVTSAILCLAFSASALWAQQAQVTANLNFRAGPSTSNAVLATIPEGSNVEFLECNDSGSWCAIEYDGQTGFVSGKYLVYSEDEDASRWPRAFGLEGESFIVLYEPQFSGWEDYRFLDAVVAAEFRETDDADPIFGVIGLRGESARNQDDSTVVINNIEVTQLDFAALDRTQLGKLSVGVGELLPSEAITVSEERIVAGLANFEQIADIEGLKADPPVIFASNDAARLLQTDGEAVFAPVQGAPGVEFVINTNWDLFRVDDALWLRDETSWLTASALDAEWAETLTLPDALSALPEDGNWDETREALSPVAYDEGAPTFYYSDTAAELIIFDGPPAFQDVPGGDLEWAENTEADVFRLKTSGTYYYLVSGRWFSAPSLDGPWVFATPDLPDDFLNIADDVPYYTVRASVPGTSEANEARLRAVIPELARVSLADITAPEVSYDGEPVFEPIEGTDMSYAVNTQSQVIEVQGRYFLVVDGIWFVSNSAEGPWSPATEVPEVIYDIPPSSPVHNVSYVKVYEYDESTKEVVYGYTAGYLHGFLAWGIFGYGSGWYYPPYWGNYPDRPIYYPRPITYGGATYYNPARGTFGRYGYAYGPHRGIQGRTVWNPKTDTYARGVKVYGPEGSRGFVHAFNPRTGTNAVARGGENIYGKWGSAAVRKGSDYLRVKGANPTDAGKGVKWDSSRGSGFAASDRRGNTYAGRDGNVYRKVGDSWEKWEPKSGWNGVQAPDRSALQDRGQVRDRAQARETLQSRTNANRQPVNRTQPRNTNRVPSNVGRDAIQRNRANELSHQTKREQQLRKTTGTPQRTRQPAANTRTRAAPKAAPQRTAPRATPQRQVPRATPQRQVPRAAPKAPQRRPNTGARRSGGGNFKGRGRR